MTEPYNWPDRDTWARNRRTFKEPDQVRNLVSDQVSAYASPDEVAQACAELDAVWRALGRELRPVNAAAKEAFPLKDSMKEVGVEVYFAARDALTDDRRAVVDQAVCLLNTRTSVREVWRELAAGRCAGLHHPRHCKAVAECTTYLEIMGRWRSAQRAAVEALRLRVESSPIDDQAWAEELERRVEMEERRRSPIQVGRSATV